jgi:hypothetical protein
VARSRMACSPEDAMRQAGESPATSLGPAGGPSLTGEAGSRAPATNPTKERRADGQLVAGDDALHPRAKDPGGREQHAVQRGAGSIGGVETARRTGDEQHPTRAGNPVGRRGSEEGGPPTPSAAAKRTPIACRLFTADGVEVLVTQICTKCGRSKPLAAFGLRRMPDGKIRSIPRCKACRGGEPRDRRQALLFPRVRREATTA